MPGRSAHAVGYDVPHARQAPEVGEDPLGVGAGTAPVPELRDELRLARNGELGVAIEHLLEERRKRRRRCVPLFDFGPRPERYSATLELPEVEPLGAAHAVEPRSIDVGLLDSRE